MHNIHKLALMFSSVNLSNFQLGLSSFRSVNIRVISFSVLFAVAQVKLPCSSFRIVSQLAVWNSRSSCHGS